MLYMIIEDFRDGDAGPVYRRFRESGRQCYQVMECDDRALLDEWMARWADLVTFRVVPVMTSADAAAIAASQSQDPGHGS
jgi:hypothetical protein